MTTPTHKRVVISRNEECSALFVRGHRAAPNTPARLTFLRRELARCEAQAAFNRTHYSEAEAACWVALAADANAAIAKVTGATP